MFSPAETQEEELPEQQERSWGAYTPDDLELAEVSKILSELKDDHAARQAFIRGANTLSLAGMVENPDISQRLRRAYLAGFERTVTTKRAG